MNSELMMDSQQTALIGALADLVDESFLYDHTKEIFESDRWSNFTAYNNTAAWLQQRLTTYGLDDVELEAVPADGKTLFGDWIAPLAWDVTEAYLDVFDADEQPKRFCDYKTLPDTIIMGSAATPASGLRAQIISIDDAEISTKHLQGCIALTARKACDVKRAVHDAGGVGVLSFFHPFPEEDPDSVFWNNCWSDRKGGWWQTAQDSRLSGFSISPNQGEALMQRLASGEKIMATAKVESRIYEGTLPFVSGRIKGSELPDEEILLLSHLYEHGAHDNATGSASNLEIARAISVGIQSGVIERPKRSLRFLFMAECYGTMAYAQYRAQRMQTTKAAISLDGVGAAWPLNVHRESDIARSPLGPAIAAIAEEVYKGDQHAVIQTVSVEPSDTMLADPLIGVPTAWPHRACKDRTWHTSLDTLDKIDPHQMKGMALTVAAALLRFASLSSSDASGIARLCARQSLRNLQQKKAEQAVLEHEKYAELSAIDMIKQFAFIDNFTEIDEQIEQVKSEFVRDADICIQERMNDLTDDQGASMADVSSALLQNRVFSRDLFGHISLDPINDEEFSATHICPRWSPWQIAAFWSVDGKRTFAEIHTLIYGEFQVSLKELTDYFFELQKFKYIQTENE